MTPEERFERIEQKIEFIVNQQAQFAADLQQARGDLRAEMQERQALMQQQIDQHEKQINALNTAVVALIGTTHGLTEAQKKTEAELKELAVVARESQERLNIFINVVERYLSERRNGQAMPDNDKPKES